MIQLSVLLRLVSFFQNTKFEMTLTFNFFRGVFRTLKFKNIHHGSFLKKYTAWKVSVFGVFLVRIFPHSDWVQRYTEYLSVISPNMRKYGPEKLQNGYFSRSDSWPKSSIIYVWQVPVHSIYVCLFT